MTKFSKGENDVRSGYFSNYHSFDDNGLSDFFLITSCLLMVAPES